MLRQVHKFFFAVLAFFGDFFFIPEPQTFDVSLLMAQKRMFGGIFSAAIFTYFPHHKKIFRENKIIISATSLKSVLP